ncbi:hypothetical protein IFM89_000141 [Coptis chinensis]|uniref:SAC3 family protein A n=1 Tax=Coptis chinensis TaxID=261450 RepID=A0A835H076_9MAGN|nr:hypothetical protein IFM89_000141 [Coptis chinensis]
MAQSNEVVDPSLGESSTATAAYAPQEPSSYGSYSSSTDPQNYNYYGYQQQHGGAYQNSGAPYQPITSFQNTGSYAGSTSYPTTYYNTGDYQTTQLYPGSGYSNQTTATWHDPSYPSHQYSNYDSNVAHSSSAAAAAQLSYEQQYKQWADYYSQTTSNVSCAPGTENISTTCTSTQNVRVSAVANDYIPLESQPPPPGTTSWRQEPSSSELPSLQVVWCWMHGLYVMGFWWLEDLKEGLSCTIAGVVTVPSDTSNGYWRHEALGFQNHHVTQTLSYSDAPAYNQTASYSPAPSYIQTPLSQAPLFTQAPALYQNSLDLNPVQYENSQNLQKTAGPHGSNSQYPTIHQIPQSYHSPMQTVSSFDTSRVNKVQIPTNPRIASNLAMGLPKTDKGSPTTTVATKPAYVSVSMPKSDSNLPSHSATDSMLKPGTFPQSLRAYVERALARCKSDLQKTACQTIMKEIITKASADGLDLDLDHWAMFIAEPIAVRAFGLGLSNGHVPVGDLRRRVPKYHHHGGTTNTETSKNQQLPLSTPKLSWNYTPSTRHPTLPPLLSIKVNFSIVVILEPGYRLSSVNPSPSWLVHPSLAVMPEMLLALPAASSSLVSLRMASSLSTIESSLQNPSILSSATKYKRSPSRRTKSRWEPMPEEKLVEKLAAVNQLPVKDVSWNHVKEREKTVSGGKFENKGGWSNAKPFHSQQQNQSKPSQKPFKKPRFGDIYKVTENGDASSDSEKEQGLTAYYSGAIALANTPEERKRRESRSKRFDKGPGQHTQIKNIRTKVVGGGNLYTKRASALTLVLGKGAEDGGSRAVEDIDWDSLTVKGTCQEIEKRYLRLTSAPDPATVRPEEVLEKALLMVLSSPKNYLYKCDQLKSVRQDLTVQRIRNELTVRVYETHARLALEAGDLPEYNQVWLLRTVVGYLAH